MGGRREEETPAAFGSARVFAMIFNALPEALRDGADDTAEMDPASPSNSPERPPAGDDAIPMWMSSTLNAKQKARMATEKQENFVENEEHKPMPEKYLEHDGGTVHKPNMVWELPERPDEADPAYKGPKSKCLSQAFSPDGKLIAVGLTTGGVQIVNLTGNEPVAAREIRVAEKRDNDPVTTVRFHPKSADPSRRNVLLSCTSNGKVRLYHATTGQTLGKLKENNKIFASGFMRDGSFFVTGGEDACLRVYDYQRRQVVREIEPGSRLNMGHTSNVYCICPHPTDSNLFVSSGWDCCMNMWDLRLKLPAVRAHGPYVCADSIDMSVDRPHELISGSRTTSENLQLWDVRVLSSSVVGQMNLQTNLPFKKHAQEPPCLLFAARFVNGDEVFGERCIISGGGGENPAVRLFHRDIHCNVGSIKTNGSAVYAIDVHNHTHNHAKSTNKVAVLFSDRIKLFDNSKMPAPRWNHA